MPIPGRFWTRIPPIGLAEPVSGEFSRKISPIGLAEAVSGNFPAKSPRLTVVYGNLVWQNKLHIFLLTLRLISRTIMILTTTPTVEGRQIKEYKGIVFGEVVNGVNFVKDLKASVRNIIGGRSGSYEKELIDARSKAMSEMESRARELGANAVVGIDLDYEVLGEANGMLMVTASGTAVVIE